MHFILFFPDAKGCDPKHLDACDLGAFKEDAHLHWWDVMRGPDDLAGMACIFLDDPLQIPSWGGPDSYHWYESRCKRYWVGTSKSDPPKPSELSYSSMLPGHVVTLADGNEWMIPIPSSLPHHLQLGENDELITKVKPEKQWYFDRAQELAASFFDTLGMRDVLEKVKPEMVQESTPVFFKIPDGLKLVAAGLGMNYRIKVEIMNALNLCDNDTIKSAFCAAIDLPDIMCIRDQKKTEDTATIHVI